MGQMNKFQLLNIRCIQAKLVVKKGGTISIAPPNLTK